MITNIYIDGFNLYYGSLRNYPQFKWLDLSKLCHALLPGSQINRIRYFTAPVTAFPYDPQAPDRQAIYLRALRTIPNLTVHLGRFSIRPVRMPRYPLGYTPSHSRPVSVSVLRTEEKRSDVNLATYLLVDCFDNDFDQAVVVSNDSDLTLPVETVNRKFGKLVGVINPHPRRRISRELEGATTFQIKSINRKVLANSQFPRVLSDAKGEFRRPDVWS